MQLPLKVFLRFVKRIISRFDLSWFVDLPIRFKSSIYIYVYIYNYTFTRWFKVTFLPPSWRSLNHLKGSLNHPKTVTLNPLGPWHICMKFSYNRNQGKKKQPPHLYQRQTYFCRSEYPTHRSKTPSRTMVKSIQFQKSSWGSKRGLPCHPLKQPLKNWRNPSNHQGTCYLAIFRVDFIM